MSNSFIYPNNFLFNFFYSNAGLQIRGDDFLFGSVFIKKNNQNRLKPTGFGSVIWEKTGSSRFGSVFPDLAQFFFGVFCSGSVRFFRFQAYKTELVGFFKIPVSLIDFFYGSVFFIIFFYFLSLIDFLNFLLALTLHPVIYLKKKKS